MATIEHTFHHVSFFGERFTNLNLQKAEQLLLQWLDGLQFDHSGKISLVPRAKPRHLSLSPNMLPPQASWSMKRVPTTAKMASLWRSTWMVSPLVEKLTSKLMIVMGSSLLLWMSSSEVSLLVNFRAHSLVSVIKMPKSSLVGQLWLFLVSCVLWFLSRLRHSYRRGKILRCEIYS